jgi:hypothetical protein
MYVWVMVELENIESIQEEEEMQEELTTTESCSINSKN